MFFGCGGQSATEMNAASPPPPSPGPLASIRPAANFTTSIDGTDILVSWNVDNVPSDATLEVYRNDVEDLPGRTRIVRNAPFMGSFLDESLDNGQSYWYMMKITLANGDTVNTEPEAGTLIPVDAIPNPKANLSTALAGIHIDVSWDLQNYDPAVTGVTLYRNTVDAMEGREMITESTQTATTFRDRTVELGTDYWYMLEINQGEDLVTNTDPVGPTNVPLDATPLPNETNLSTSISGTDVTVTWDLQNFDPEITFLELYRNDEPVLDGRTRIVRGAALSGSFVDELLEPGVTYYYMFKVTQGDAGVTNTDPEAETAIPADAIPNPKTNLVATIAGAAIDLTWDLQNFDPAITQLELYRNTVNELAGRTRILPGATSTGSFTDTTVEPGVTYWYMFKVTQGDAGVFNTDPEAETTIPLAVPTTNATATVNGLSVDLTWNLQNFEPEITYFEVYRNTTNALSGRTRIVADATNPGSFTDTGVEAGGEYWYMFKVTLGDAGTVNTDPELRTVIPAS